LSEVIISRKGEKIKAVEMNGIISNLLLKTDTLEALLTTFEIGATKGLIRHLGHEVHIILQGEILAEIDGKEYSLSEEDVICFPSILPHTMRNAGKVRAILFSISTPPTYI